MQIQQSSEECDSNLPRIFLASTPVVLDKETDEKETVEKQSVVSKNFSSSDLMMASFEKLWEKANQDADLAMLSNTSSFATSSTQRPQSALVRVCFALLFLAYYKNNNNSQQFTTSIIHTTTCYCCLT